MGSCVTFNSKTFPQQNIIAVAHKTQNRKEQQQLIQVKQRELLVQKDQSKQTTNTRKINRNVPNLKPLNENKLYVNRAKIISTSLETLESVVVKKEQECVSK